MMLGTHANAERIAALREHLGLDKPIWEQFILFLSNLAHGNLGNSVTAFIPVTEVIKPRVPLTLFLVSYAMFLALVISIPISLFAALHRGSIIDQIIRVTCVLFYSTPEFWIGIILMLILSVGIPIFPVGGIGKTFGERLYYLFLPALTMALHVSAVLTRNLRDSIITELSSEHVVLARAKGLKPELVLIKHVLRNSMVSGATLFGLYLTWLVGGSVIIESVFAIPGIGWGMVTSILGRDYPVVQGITLIYAIMVSIITLSTDLAYTILDPRVSL
jgi:peptide/nickel transport system permease protein